MNPISSAMLETRLRAISGPEAIDGMRVIQEREAAASAPGAAGGGEGFGEILTESINKVNELQVEADGAVKRLATGESGNLHEALLSMQRAEISMRMLMEVRNKVVTAYQEIMRMPV